MFLRIRLLVVGLALSLAVTPAAARTETFHYKFKGLTDSAAFDSFHVVSGYLFHSQ